MRKGTRRGVIHVAAGVGLAVVVGYGLAAAVSPRVPVPPAGATRQGPSPSGTSAPAASPSASPTPTLRTSRLGGAAGRFLGKAKTVVSLTFDDGSASQYSTLAMLRSHKMVGTYYINTAMVGSSSYYMTWPEIGDLAAAGNEIGGHTLHHLNVLGIDPAKERTEICEDRAALRAAGLPAVSFAYPEGGRNAAAEKVVRGCGYSNARGTGGLWYPGCASCAYAETMPPADRYAIRTASGATTATTLAELQASVTEAEEHGGGWVPLVFHGICDDRCTAGNSLPPAVFSAFLEWLAPRTAKGTVVGTVAQVIGAS